MLIISLNIKLSKENVQKLKDIYEMVIVNTAEGIDELPLILERKKNAELMH